MPEHEINLVASSQADPEADLLGGARSCKVDHINHKKDCIFFVLLCREENILHTGTMKQALTVNRHGKMALRLRDILKYYVNQNNKLT